MMTLEAMRQIAIVTKGFDEAQRDVEQLASASKKLTSAFEATNASLMATGRQIDALERSVDAGAKAKHRYKANVDLLNRALADGVVSAERHAQIMGFVEQRYQAAIRTTNQHSTAVGVNRGQLQQLSFQLNDMATMLASGSSPFQILATQGGQVFQIFQQGQNGVGGSIRAIASHIGSLLTPVRLVAGGFAAMGVAAAIAMEDATQRAIRMQQALNGVGARSGQTVGGLNSIAYASAGRGVSIASAQDLAGGFANAGLGGAGIAAMTASTRDFAKAFGLELDAAGKELAQAFRDPVKGADELNRRFGTLGDATMEEIRRARDQGDAQRAQALLTRAYTDAMSQVTVRTNALSDAMENFKSVLSNIWTRFGQSLSGPTPQQDLESALRLPRAVNREVNRKQRQQWAMAGHAVEDVVDKSESNRLNNVMEAWRKAMEESGKALMRQRSVDLADQSRVAGGYMRDALPWEENAKRVADRIKAIGEALKSGALTGEDGNRAAEVLERLGNQYRLILSPMQQITLTSAMQIQQTLAMTAAQRAAVSAQQAYIQALSEGKTRAEAAASAEAAVNQARAEGLRQAREALRDAQNQSRLAGLLPGERAKEENRIAIETLRRNAEVGSTGALPQVFVPFKLGLDNSTSAVQNFTAAINGAAGAVGARGGYGASPNVNVGSGPGNGYGGIKREDVAQMIREIAMMKGIDPSIALRVAQSEGLNTYVGDKGTSFGPFQLHYGGLRPGALGAYGMGDDFTRATGLNARDPSSLQQQIEYALSRAQKEGWGAWYGARNVGITGFMGINGGAQSSPRFGLDPNEAGRTIDRTAEEREKARLKDLELRYNRQPALETDTMTASLQRQIAVFGQSSAAVAAATREQELLNRAKANGEELTGSMIEKINEEARRYGQVVTAQQQYADALQRLNDIRGGVSEAANGFFMSLARGEGAAKALNGALNSLTSSLIRMATNMMMSGLFGDSKFSGGLLSSLFSGLMGGGSGGVMALPASMGTGTGGIYALGGVFSGGNVMAFANGGVVGGPTVFPMTGGRTGLMGEAGPEGIMPLRRGPDGRLGVSAYGGASGGSGKTTVNVHNYGNSQVRTEDRGEGPDGRMLDVYIEEKVAEVIAGGRADSAMSGRYGRKPTPVFR